MNCQKMQLRLLTSTSVQMANEACLFIPLSKEVIVGPFCYVTEAVNILLQQIPVLTTISVRKTKCVREKDTQNFSEATSEVNVTCKM